jgi:transposase InsO family protein
MPTSIVSDRDPVFTSLFWKELFKLHGTELKFSSAYHPQTDGQTKIVNKCVEQYLRCFSGDKPKEWSRWLPLAKWWYNTNIHASTNFHHLRQFTDTHPHLCWLIHQGQLQFSLWKTP